MYVFKKDTYKVKGMEEWVVEGEWLEGKPHGVCIYDGKNSKGVATFTRGQLHGGPRWGESKILGSRYSSECIMDGKGVVVYREYNSDKQTSNVSDNENNTPTPGWMGRVKED